MIELTQSGTWYTLEVDYDNQWNLFKANGKKELNALIDDLIHDVKLDNRFDLVPVLEELKK